MIVAKALPMCRARGKGVSSRIENSEDHSFAELRLPFYVRRLELGEIVIIAAGREDDGEVLKANRD